MEHDFNAQETRFRKIGMSSQCRPHLVTLEKGMFGKPVLTAHISTGVGSSKARKAVLSELRQIEGDARCAMKQHKQSKLETAPSLEDFASRYGNSEIVFDPTKVVSRTRALVSFAHDIRAEFTQDELVGVYWDAALRTAYVVLDPSAYFSDKKIKGTDIKAAEARVAQAARSYIEDESSIAEHILLSFEMPAAALVPVDAASFFDLGDAKKSRKGRLAMGVAGALVGAMSATSLAADPAVSAVNSKFGYENVSTYSDSFGQHDADLFTGSVTSPIGEKFGLQIDGAFGSSNGDSISGIGGHLFWRDPSVAMVGLTFGVADFDRVGLNPNQTLRRLGVEVEYYLEDFTVYASLGRQTGTNILEGNFGSIGLGWYATDNLKFSLDLSTTPDVESITSIGAEWQPAFAAADNLSVYADASRGSDDYESISLGFRMYFGGGSGKTLIERHRYDDPEDNIVLGIVRSAPQSRRPKSSY